MTLVGERLVGAPLPVNPLERPKQGVDTPDDDFDFATLSGKWTVVNGSSGTVDLLETGNVAKYDLTTRPGWLLFQVGSAGTENVDLRQDYTLPDGASIVLAVSPSALFDDQSASSHGIVNNELKVGLTLNSDDADPETTTTAGLAQILANEMDTGEIELSFAVANTAGANQQLSENLVTDLGRVLYLRIARSGSSYYGFYSVDGSSWVALGGASPSGTALNNVWVHANSGASYGDPVPVQAVDWIRQGTNALDPW